MAKRGSPIGASDLKSLLAVFAHPDDESFRPGRTLALLARRGVAVHLLTATRGEASSCGDPPFCRPEELSAVLEQELRCACAALEVEFLRLLDYQDGHLGAVDPGQLTARILEAVQEVHPQVMLSFGLDGLSAHTDHVAIGRCAAEVFSQAEKVAALYTLAVQRSLAERLGMRQVRPVPDECIALAVDVSPVWETKLAAIGCHATQLSSSPMMHATVEKQRAFFGMEYFMLTGLTRPTSGQARVMGLDLARDVARIKKRVGVVPEASNLYDELSAFDNLVFTMQLYGVPRAERKARAEKLLHRFRLGEKRDAPFARLSRGMKRALTIAAALAHRPPLLFSPEGTYPRRGPMGGLDEPTTGLDVMSARNLRRLIAGLREEGVTVFLTTHYLEEAERLCDRVAIIVRGRIVAMDSVDGLKGRMQSRTTIEVMLGDGGDGIETLTSVGASSSLSPSSWPSPCVTPATCGTWCRGYWP